MPRIRAANIEAHKELTRRQILDAAHRIIADVGSADISLAEVATDVGIGRTTLYEYFRDKDDLIASMVEARLPELVQDLINDASDGDVKERLQHLAVATVRFIVEDRVLGLILHRELPRLSQGAQERIRLSHQDLATRMTGLYLQGVREGRFRQMAPDIAGRFMNEVIMAAAKVLIVAADPAARLGEVTSSMSDFLFDGFEISG